ncbi:hypothetical protein Afil01_51030 [Actinorhabdospora filicis]|uniref:Ricin B lectin domain-containing protein n=1 Tax=Actinorhabdospora filicis TaxID=1785913 RepID=A0A9W6SQB5_9ACTN|nr:RICIN domain-containing protein [Actinorhabdospora filicis]GLZ80296.1 hypothetical protein Afil01_51030 [Actinorhabdospora filicis]
MRSKDALIAGAVAVAAFGSVFAGLSLIRGEFRDNTVDMYRDYDSGEAGGRDFALPDHGNEIPPKAEAPAPSAELPLVDGAYTLRPAHSLMCLTSGLVDGRTLLIQRDCVPKTDKKDGEKDDKASAPPEVPKVPLPTIQLTETGGGSYLLQIAAAPGTCMTVDYGIGEEGRLIGQQACNLGLYHQRYVLTAVKGPVAGGFQIRPEHSDLCLTVPGASTDSGVALIQSACREDAPDQEFMVDPAIV